MCEQSRPGVLVLDDDPDFCDLVAAVLETSTEVACIATHSLRELVLHAREALACALAILDVNLGAGQPSGLDALDWLRAHSFRGRIVFLTGHARGHPRLREEQAAGVSVLEKPVDVDELVSITNASAPARAPVHGEAHR